MNHTNNGQQYLLQETNYKEEVLKVYPDAVYVHFPESVYFKHHIRLYAVEAIKSIGVSNKSEEEAWNTAYLDLPHTPTTITVTGCWDCPMYSVEDGYNYCKMQKVYELFMSELFRNCPLKTDSITIKLMQDETQNTTTAS